MKEAANTGIAHAASEAEGTRRPARESKAGNGEAGERPGEATGGKRHDRVVLAAVWLVSALYLGWHLRRGWVPHDAGAFGESAARVLLGQAPHRDFGELYTGGLSYLDAVAFRLWGINCMSLRMPVFLFFLGWVPAIYFIAGRFAAPLGAGAVTLLAVAWSVPNYPEAVPSWYNLFFATWGMLALLGYSETDRRRWLWIAGLCGGLSFLVKIAGLYFVAAGLLFLIYHEQSGTREESAAAAPGGRLYRAFVLGGLAVFVGAVVKLVEGARGGHGMFSFALPCASIAALLVGRELRLGGAGSAARFRRLLAAAGPFLAGALAPVVIFLGWYARAGGLRAWFAGTFVLPTTRYNWAAFSAPSWLTLTGLGPLAAVLLLAYFGKGITGRLTGALVIAGLGGLLAAARQSLPAYEIVGLSVAALVPLAAMALLFARGGRAGAGEPKRQQVFLVVAVAALCSLVQFPFAAPIYFCYVAPLVAVAVVALVSTTGQPDRVSIGGLVGFYLLFAVWLGTPGYYTVLRAAPGRQADFRKLDLARGGGLEVKAGEAEEYEQVVRLVEAHARGGYIYAGPDSPEVYFLSGLRNPTGTLFDFLDADFGRSAERSKRLLGAVDEHNVAVVALKSDAEFSGPVPAELEAGLEARFPHAQRVGDFEVRWK